MGLLDKIFGGSKKRAAEARAAEAALGDCPHAVLVPRWESVQDMGHEDKITRFMCEACQAEFPPDEAARMRESVNERMDASLSEYREEATQGKQ